MKKLKKNKKKPIKPDDAIKYTVCGEWFPLFLDYYPDPYGKKDETPLDTEMRLFCACTRWAFNRILEGAKASEIEHGGQEKFVLNGRCIKDAVAKADWIVSSQKELLALEIAETKTKLARAKKKLGWTEKDLDKAIEKNNLVKIEKSKRTVHGRKARVKKLADKLNELQAHQNNGTIPTVVIETKPGQGTRVKIEIPLSGERNA